MGCAHCHLNTTGRHMHLREKPVALALLNFGLAFTFNEFHGPCLVSFANRHTCPPAPGHRPCPWGETISEHRMHGQEMILPPCHFSQDDSDCCTCGATPNRRKHPHHCPCLLGVQDVLIGFALGNTQPFGMSAANLDSNKTVCPSHVVSPFCHFTHCTDHVCM